LVDEDAGLMLPFHFNIEVELPVDCEDVVTLTAQDGTTKDVKITDIFDTKTEKGAIVSFDAYRIYKVFN